MRKVLPVILVLLLIVTAMVFTACENKGDIIKITFDLKDGINFEELELKIGDLLEEPVPPEREGYTFSGWFYDEECTVPFTFEKLPEESLTIYAKWEIKKFTYTFYDGDGTTVLKADTVDYGSAIIAPAAPAKAATVQYTYTFSGWDKEIPRTIRSDISFVAQYTAAVNKYTYTFYDEDGDTVIKTETVDYGSAITPPANPAKPSTESNSYIFTGWDKEIPAQITGDISFVANFEETARQYVYTFLDDDGSVISTNSGLYGTSITVPSDPDKDETAEYTYTFSHWDKDIPATLTADITFTAVYTRTPRSYKLTFVTNGGDHVDDITAAFGSSVTAPACTQPFYEFQGWFTAENEAFDFSSMPARNVILYAKWELAPGYCEVTVIGGDGTGIYAVGSLIGLSATIPANHLLDTWKVNGQPYCNFNNFYYPASEGLVIEATYKLAPYTPVVPVEDSPLPALPDFPVDYPLELSRIKPGYSALYVSTASKYYELFALYADDTFVYQYVSKSPDSLYFYIETGRLSDDSVFVECSMEYNDDSLYYELFDTPYYGYDNYGKVTITDYLAECDFFYCVNINVIDMEIPEEGILLSYYNYSDPIYWAVGKSIDDGLLYEIYITTATLMRFDSEPDFEEYPGADHFIGNVYILWENYYPYNSGEIEGFDNSEAGEGTIVYYGFEIPIIYFDEEEPLVTYWEIYYDIDSVFMFQQYASEEDVLDCLNSDDSIRLYIQYSDSNWSYADITMDYIQGLSTLEAGKFTFTLRVREAWFEDFVYYVIPEDSDPDDILDVTCNTFVVSDDGTLVYGDAYIFYTDGRMGYVTADDSYEDSYGEYAVVLYASSLIASGDLIIDTTGLVFGEHKWTITVFGLTIPVDLIYNDADNLQLYVSENYYEDDDKILINTDGTVFLYEPLSSWFILSDYSYYGGEIAPPIKYFIGLDLTAPGRQQVYLYNCYGQIYPLWVIVYENEIPPRGYEVVMPEMFAVGTNPTGIIKYYSSPDFYSDSPVMYTDEIVTIEDIDTSVGGWQKAYIFIDRINDWYEVWIYFYESEDEIIGYELYYAPDYLIWKENLAAISEQLLPQIILTATKVDGSTMQVSGIDAEIYLRMTYNGWAVILGVMKDALDRPGTMQEYTDHLIKVFTQEDLDDMYSYEYMSAIDSYRLTSVNTEILSTLTELRLPAYFNDKPVYTFYQGIFDGAYNYKLKSLIIPSTYTELYPGSFSRFVHLREIRFESITPPTLGDNIFGSAESAAIFVPDQSVNDYKTVLGNIQYTGEFYALTNGYFANRVYGTAQSAEEFFVVDGVLVAYFGIAKDIVIPNVVTKIGAKAFRNARYLRSVSLPASLTEIGKYAFAGSYLERVYFLGTSSLELIDDYAFMNCNLKSFDCPASLREIGAWAFDGCRYLESVTLNEGLKIIDSNAFRECGFKDITIPESVEYIGEYVFLDTLYTNSFYGAVIRDGWLLVLNDDHEYTGFYTVPEGVKGIAAYAFFNCNKLVIRIESDDLIYVCRYAFGGDIEDVYINLTTPPDGLDRYSFAPEINNIFVPYGYVGVYRELLGDLFDITTITEPES